MNSIAVIRLVIEIGSLGQELRKVIKKDNEAIVKQLHTYLAVIGMRGFRGPNKAVGLCIIGTEVAILRSIKTTGKFQVTVNKWVSIYSGEFREFSVLEISNVADSNTIVKGVRVGAPILGDHCEGI